MSQTEEYVLDFCCVAHFIFLFIAQHYKGVQECDATMLYHYTKAGLKKML